MSLFIAFQLRQDGEGRRLLHRFRLLKNRAGLAREREMLFALLRRYPVVIGAHYRTRHPSKTDEAKKNQQLLEEALAEGISTGHPDMPEFVATPDQIDAILDYISSLND